MDANFILPEPLASNLDNYLLVDTKSRGEFNLDNCQIYDFSCQGFMLIEDDELYFNLRRALFYSGAPIVEYSVLNEFRKPIIDRIEQLIMKNEPKNIRKQYLESIENPFKRTQPRSTYYSQTG